MKFLNESRIIEVKQDRNNEYSKSNDSASTPELGVNIYYLWAYIHEAFPSLKIFRVSNVV